MVGIMGTATHRRSSWEPTTGGTADGLGMAAQRMSAFMEPADRWWSLGFRSILGSESGSADSMVAISPTQDYGVSIAAVPAISGMIRSEAATSETGTILELRWRGGRAQRQVEARFGLLSRQATAATFVLALGLRLHRAVCEAARRGQILDTRIAIPVEPQGQVLAV